MFLCAEIHSQPTDTIKVKIDTIAAQYLQLPNSVGIIIGIYRQRANPNDPLVPEIYSYGRIRKDSAAPKPDSLTLFKLGSLGKTFTATVLAYLMEHHTPVVRLSDRINKHLPDSLMLPVWVNSMGLDSTWITLGDLAMHYSSLPDRPTNFVSPPGYTIQLLYEFLELYRDSLTHKPSTHWLYSNTGFGLLGNIVSRIANVPYQDLTTQVFADSLDMPDTRVYLTPQQRARVALGYSGVTGALDTMTISPAFYGAGGHYSCMKDLMNYLAWNMGFRNTTLNSLLNSLHKERRFAFNDTVAWQGLAWQMDYLSRSYSNEKFIWKDGATNGYSTYMGWMDTTKTGVIVLCNSTNAADPIATNILRVLNGFPLLGVIGINPTNEIFPEKFSLLQNYPNPFNPVTKIKFDIPSNVKSQTSNMKLVVYDALGKEVAVLVDQKLEPGSYEVEFNGENLGSGVYFYKLVSGNLTETKSMILLK